VLQLPLEWVYRGAAACLTLAICQIIYNIFSHLKIDENLKIWLLSLLILNPYSFRYYWIVPVLLADLVFVYSLGILIWGLINRKQKWIYLGVFMGALSRQNEILI